MQSGKIEQHEYPGLSFYLKKTGHDYIVWLNGCRIGKPEGQAVHEFKTPRISIARDFIKAEAARRLWAMIQAHERELLELKAALEGLIAEGVSQ